MKISLALFAFLSPFLAEAGPFAADITPPVIHEIRVDSPVYINESFRVFLKITEEGSGLHWLITVLDWSDRPDIREVLSVRGSGIKDEGDGWYSMEFKLGEFKPAGIYRISSVDARDRAGNQGDVYAWEDGEFYVGTNLKVVTVQALRRGD